MHGAWLMWKLVAVTAMVVFHVLCGWLLGVLFREPVSLFGAAPASLVIVPAILAPVVIWLVTAKTRNRGHQSPSSVTTATLVFEDERTAEPTGKCHEKRTETRQKEAHRHDRSFRIADTPEPLAKAHGKQHHGCDEVAPGGGCGRRMPFTASNSTVPAIPASVPITAPAPTSHKSRTCPERILEIQICEICSQDAKQEWRWETSPSSDAGDGP